MNNNQNKKELVNEWLLRAEDDELNIGAILKDRDGTSARYPADIPLENFTWIMAEQAFGAANKIKDFVLDKIKAK